MFFCVDEEGLLKKKVLFWFLIFKSPKPVCFLKNWDERKGILLLAWYFFVLVFPWEECFLRRGTVPKITRVFSCLFLELSLCGMNLGFNIEWRIQQNVIGVQKKLFKPKEAFGKFWVLNKVNIFLCKELQEFRRLICC